jgi:hypothetical protein
MQREQREAAATPASQAELSMVASKLQSRSNSVNVLKHRL